MWQSTRWEVASHWQIYVKIAEYFANRSAKLAKWQSTLAAWPAFGGRVDEIHGDFASREARPGSVRGTTRRPEAAAAATSQSDANRFMHGRGT